MKVYGQLEYADLHNRASDPVASLIGRIYWQTTSTKVMVDDGTNILAMLRNDQVCILGNHATAANNIRLQRGASGVLQFVVGSDVTAEGTLSTSLAQISARLENYANASKPAVGNAGRLIHVTDSDRLQLDDGATWLSMAPLTTKGDIYVRNATNNTRLPVGADGFVLVADSAQTLGVKWAATSSTVTQYAAIVASPAIAGLSTHTTWTAAIAATVAGDAILITKGTYNENLTLTSSRTFFGTGRGAVLNGTLTFAGGSDYTMLRDLKIAGNVVVSAGVTNLYISSCFLASSATVTDNSGLTTNYILFSQE